MEITGPVSKLLCMTFRTGLFNRSGPNPAVAVRTLIVGCIRLGRHFGIFNVIGVMAVQTAFGRRGVFFRVFEMAFTAGDESSLVITRMMMAIIAGNVVFGGMLGMLKKDVASGAAILDSEGLIRGFDGKSGVTEKTYNKENDSHAVDQLQISL